MVYDSSAKVYDLTAIDSSNVPGLFSINSPARANHIDPIFRVPEYSWVFR
jgi:hypothetical protein